MTYLYLVNIWVMASIQSVLMNKPNRLGLFPLAIRIIKNRKPSYLFIGQYLEKEFWDDQNKRVKKSHPNSKRLNALLANKLADANDKLIESENEGNNESVKKIKKKIVGKSKMDFFQASEAFLENLLKRKKFNQHYNQEKRLNIFKFF